MKFLCAVLLGLLLEAGFPQGAAPAYVREGDRVEQRFRQFRDALAEFLEQLRTMVRREAPVLMRQLEEPPPPTNVYGYRLLPRIVEIPQPPAAVSTFSYSWPITEGYVSVEFDRLERARSDLRRVNDSRESERLSLLTKLVAQYGDLVRNQRTVDQYVQYNRFWQQAIAEDRARFDRLTELYNSIRSGGADTVSAIRKALGEPSVPNFIRVQREAGRVVLRVRLYSDIDDAAYLAQASGVIEGAWQAEENGAKYVVEVDLQAVPAGELYRPQSAPAQGDHIDLAAHAARFPTDGGVLTTGAQFTHGVPGRYIALGPGDLSPRTLAHEFGHLLGFGDGYIRGYADLGEQGFEILELTSAFDDIMSAPRQGRVQPAHFKLLLEALE